MEIHRADKAYRTRSGLLLAVIAVLCAALLWQLNGWLSRLTGTLAAVPGCRFKLLGTKGMLRTAGEVSAAFPRRLRPAVEVVPEFDPAKLPGLLADCSAGVFPCASRAAKSMPSSFARCSVCSGCSGVRIRSPSR